MAFYALNYPSYPYFMYAGDALYRAGDQHRQRTGIGAFDLLAVQTGCLFMSDDSHFYEVGPGEVLILHPDHTHRSFKQCSEETYFHWLHFNTKEPFRFTAEDVPSSTSGTVGNDEQHCFVVPAYQHLEHEDADRVFAIMADLESFRINRYQQSSMVPKISSMVADTLQQQQLFLELLSIIAIDRGTKSVDAGVQIVMQYLRSNYCNIVTLQDMANIAHCHPTTLIRLFKRQYGITPAKALNAVRIEKAKGLLAHTDLSCEAVAERVGFESPSYFSKTFKRSVGCTPREYRDNAERDL